MAVLEYTPAAPGGPGIEPRWTRSAKDVVGTAYSTSSSIWFTVSDGVISEVYYPTLDRPQIRDLQYMVTDGATFFHDTHRNLKTSIEYLGEHGLGVRIINRDPEDRYRLEIEAITDPHQACVLLHTVVEGDPDFIRKLHLYVLLAPHLDVGGWGNSGNVTRVAGREFLTAHKNGTWLAMAATVPFVERSCGYVGENDGWRDLARDFRLDQKYAAVTNGNIALIAEIDLSENFRHTLALGFGHTLNRAVTMVFQSLGEPFKNHRTRFLEQWSRICRAMEPLEKVSEDGGALYRRSRELLLAHEDKNYSGALIASLSIPWGEAHGDNDLGGYHLVWTRDMVNSATGLMAAGDLTTPLRALIYLTCAQREDGSFPQNFWVDGEPYWTGIQLDEVAFPIILAWRLRKAGGLQEFDPYPMVKAAAGFLIDFGCVTPQERWEENSGYSPSTLASVIAALVCAAAFAREHGDEGLASFLLQFADFIEVHIERWTVTAKGVLVPAIPRHYIRITPAEPNASRPNEDPDGALLYLKNQAPGAQTQFPANQIIDAGFLELVRYGIRKPGDRLIEDSLRVVDVALKTEFPGGPCWRRYSHDGYGQRDDGGPFIDWGRGRPWPLLTGERAHYELAAGRDVTGYVRAMENFATRTRLLPEQIWDKGDIPDALLHYGKPTGAAMPLMWAHAEYVKLLRSIADKQVFDLIPEVAERYLGITQRQSFEVWKFNRQVTSIQAGWTLRIIANRPFVLHWGRGEWRNPTDTLGTTTALQLYFVDIPTASTDLAPIRFTFLWLNDNRWEGRDYAVEVVP
jgi:glucoamylase